MRALRDSYGKKAYDAWRGAHPDDLGKFTSTPSEAWTPEHCWGVSSFRELVGAVSFLNAMNKRSVLFFRGQKQDRDPTPSLFRDQWNCSATLGHPNTLRIGDDTRHGYWRELLDLGPRIYEICKRTAGGLPRRRDLRDVREAQWAIIQHYELWPTPLIDITSSLKVAASFALFPTEHNPKPTEGYLYVVAFPHSTGSISIDVSDRYCLARLQSVCPPNAKRPHYQDGYLVGRYPFYEPTPRMADHSRLALRLVAKFRLFATSRFWEPDFPQAEPTALLPDDDELKTSFAREFGADGRYPLLARASAIA